MIVGRWKLSSPLVGLIQVQERWPVAGRWVLPSQPHSLVVIRGNSLCYRFLLVHTLPDTLSP